MRTIVWSSTFKRAYKRMVKRQPEIRSQLETTLTALADNPFLSSLETHKLKGRLAGSWACSAGYDLRIIFEFVKEDQAEDAVFLIEIGTHDEVY